MVPDEFTINRYPDLINFDSLDFSEHDLGEFVKEYPSEFVIPLLENPESPWYLVLCNFDGSISLDHEIKVLKSKITTLESMLNDSAIENKSLRERLKKTKLQLGDLK